MGVIIEGNPINESAPLPVSVVEGAPVKHIINGNIIDENFPLAVVIIGGSG